MIWTILGISVAIMGVFCISMAETLVGKPLFENNRPYIAIATAVAGVATWLFGYHLGVKQRRKRDGTTDSTPFVLFDLRYWGPMLIVFGMITLFIRPLRQSKEAGASAPRPPSPKVLPTEPVKTPVVFPRLKMQGLILRSTRQVAIINGEAYTVGDHVGDVLVKAIDRSGVTLELRGEVKSLRLD
jgi:hypothetical protein